MSTSPWAATASGRPKQLRNLLIVWMLTGIWHGASWNFVVWGLYFGVWLALEKCRAAAMAGQAPPAFFQHVYTMLIVMVSWAIFAFDSFGRGVQSSAGPGGRLRRRADQWGGRCIPCTPTPFCWVFSDPGGHTPAHEAVSSGGTGPARPAGAGRDGGGSAAACRRGADVSPSWWMRPIIRFSIFVFRGLL